MASRARLALPRDVSIAAISDFAPLDLTNEESSSAPASSEEINEDNLSTCALWYIVLRRLVANMLAPPVVAAVLGIVVALVPPLHQVFVDIERQQDGAHLGLVYQALFRIGASAVPMGILVLGSNLAQGADWRSVPRGAIVGVAVAKMLVHPLLVSGAVIPFARLAGSATEATSAIWLVGLMVACTPTANNIMVMVEIGGQDKKSMSTCIFIQYLIAPVFMTASLTAASWLLQTTWFLPR